MRRWPAKTRAECLNNELKNLHLSINTGIVLVGRDLAIRSFTPLAAKNIQPARK
jgi:hypothetical protein